MDAATFLTMRQRRTTGSLPLEDGREVEDRLIGQEMVPVIPMTPAAELSVGSGTEVAARTMQSPLEVSPDGDEQRPNGGLQPNGAQGDDLGRLGGDRHGSMAGTRPTTRMDGDGPGGREGHNQGLSQGDDQRDRGVRDPGRPVLPQGDDRAWPGGPLAAMPMSLGPRGQERSWSEAGGEDHQPLFNLEQLKTFQDLYEAAPNVYGRVQDREVSRPTFLEKEEEELQRRLAAIQEEKKLREEEEWKTKTIGQGVEDGDILKKVLEENSKLKEMI